MRRRIQERRFYQKLNIERQWKKIHGEGSSRQSPVPIPPQDDSAAMKKIRKEEYKELMKLKEMERKKRELEEEIEREKRHLIGLQQLEQVSCRFYKQMHQVEVSLAQNKCSSFSSNHFGLESAF